MISTSPRLIFCSYHSYLDPASGAAQSTRDLLELLVAKGWHCVVLCGPILDAGNAQSLSQILRSENLSHEKGDGDLHGVSATVYHVERGGVSINAFVPQETPNVELPTREQGHAFLQLFDELCSRIRPNILLTYGGQWIALPMMRRAQDRGIKVVFSLRNHAYRGAQLFQCTDGILVPSRATQQFYRQTLGLESTAIPGPWNWENMICDSVDGRFVTFVNPQRSKGSLWVARMIHDLHRRRPDIPFLIVESRAGVNALAAGDLDLSGVSTIHRMANTPDPRHFYRVSRMVLMPSLGVEAFGRVAVEAHANGIPVLASKHGGLPEAMAGAGFLFDVPENYTAETKTCPTSAEVQPWIETIERLWDDEDFYRKHSEHCRQSAQVWHADNLYPRFVEFFQRVLSRDSASNGGMPRQTMAALFSQLLALRQANSGSMGLSQYVAILQAIFSYTAPDVLIFGCGADSNLYVMANPNGQTIILEDNEAWAKKYAHLPIVKVAYESQLGIEMNPVTIPKGAEKVAAKKWDVIVVDGPSGWQSNDPGRQQSLYLASRCVSNDGIIFIHDYQRPWETHYANQYLPPPQQIIQEPHRGDLAIIRMKKQ